MLENDPPPLVEFQEIIKNIVDWLSDKYHLTVIHCSGKSLTRSLMVVIGVLIAMKAAPTVKVALGKLSKFK